MTFRTQNFSLVELFIVAAVLGVVTSMITPSLERTADVAKDNICKTNMFNIYRASMVYIDDNDSILMGPVWGAQRPHIRHRDGWYWHHFARFLRFYMESKTGEDGASYNPSFLCPFNSEKDMQGRQLVHHRSHYRSTVSPRVGGKLIFGTPRGRNPQKPQSFYIIPRPSKKDMLVDSDLLNTPWLERIKTDNHPVPVHSEKYRNNLFFDGNVEAVEWFPPTN